MIGPPGRMGQAWGVRGARRLARLGGGSAGAGPPGRRSSSPGAGASSVGVGCGLGGRLGRRSSRLRRRPRASRRLGASPRGRRLGVVGRGVGRRFGGLRGGGAVAVSDGGAVAASWTASGRVALGDRLEQQDRAGDGGVERPDRAAHRDPHEQVAASADRRSQALALAADDDRQRPAQVGLTGGQRRVRLGAGDPQAVGVEVGQGARQVVDRAEEEMLDRAGRGLDRGRG